MATTTLTLDAKSTLQHRMRESKIYMYCIKLKNKIARTIII